VVALGKWDDAVEFVAFHPELVFAGSVAGVGASLEECDYDYFYRDGAGFGGEVRGEEAE
jgi:hypothetical protein